jgi:hypothetical protein
VLQRLLLLVLLFCSTGVELAAQRVESVTRDGVVYRASPEIAGYVSDKIGEPVWALCPELATLPAGHLGECTAGTQSGKNYTVKFRITRPGAEVDILTIEQGADTPATYRMAGRVFGYLAKALPLFLVAGAILALWSFIKMVKIRAQSYVEPLLDPKPQQPVAFDTAGAWVLHVQGPKINSDLNRVQVGLWDPIAAAWVPSLRMPRGRASLAERWARDVFHVPRAGEFVLVMNGLAELRNAPRSRVLFGRWVGGRVALHLLLGIAGSGVFLVSAIALASGSF